jgi:superfamily II DNA helicase RecQ
MVVRTVRQKLRKHKKGKVVVYGNSVPKVKELAQALGCHAYHHKGVGKASMLEDFAAGKQRVIVATSALGMGVGIPTSGASYTSIGRSPCWITRRKAAEPGGTVCAARR